jgi:two-component system alkaline phosphatase synthesis response regulator PhoP
MRKILVVDDDPMFARMVKLSIESIGGYEVFTEDRGSRAVKAARECQPDLILMDLLMPDLLGGDAAIALHADPAFRDTKVIFVTSLLDKNEQRESVKATGRLSFLPKPISREDLVALFEQEFDSALPLLNITEPIRDVSNW